MHPYTPSAMAEPPDLDALARRYVELWQDQWTALATDPQAAESMTRLMTLFAQSAAPMASFLGAFAPAAYGPGHDTEPSGAASARPASDGGDGRLDEFARRLAAIEERLARLEADTAARRPRTGTRRRKS
ncbi:MAG TPA: hypothetical protein VFO41_12275 [Alphaproteobacteria bacterium]|nr:hypothetical protein [Alphaproteobacteria bacterium]